MCCIVCPVTGWTFLWGQLYLPVHYSNKCKNIKLTFYVFLVYWNKTSNYKYKDTKISVFRNSPMSLKKSLRILRMTHIYIQGVSKKLGTLGNEQKLQPLLIQKLLICWASKFDKVTKVTKVCIRCQVSNFLAGNQLYEL